jgi:uncharacterized membrane protein YgcG
MVNLRTVVRLPAVVAFIASTALASPAFAQSAVVDKIGSLPQIAITQIDDRNSVLEGKTGTAIAVLIEHGTTDESDQDAEAAAASAVAQKFSVLVWVETGLPKGDIIYTDPALKWVTPAEQDVLSAQLQSAVQVCCLSDSLPRLVDAIATDMENGSQVPPDPRNYILDDIGLLDAAHTDAIAAREQQLESATNKGIGVILMDEQPGQSSATIALKDAESLNVKGDIAAVVWVARSGSSLTFSMVPAPAYADIIPASTADNINASFNADMQSGQIGDALVAAVDRTAAAVAGTSTPTPAASGTQSLGVGGGTPSASQGPSPQGLAQSNLAPKRGASQTWTALLILIAVAAVILIVVIAIRRNQR